MFVPCVEQLVCSEALEGWPLGIFMVNGASIVEPLGLEPLGIPDAIRT